MTLKHYNAEHAAHDLVIFTVQTASLYNKRKVVEENAAILAYKFRYKRTDKKVPGALNKYETDEIVSRFIPLIDAAVSTYCKEFKDYNPENFPKEVRAAAAKEVADMMLGEWEIGNFSHVIKYVH